MKTIGRFFREHSLWAGFVAVLVPLAVLLALQYRWLSRLEQVSAIAHRAALNNYLEAVGNEVQFFYRSSAERVLNIPASYIMTGRTGDIAAIWAKKNTEGIKRLFLVDFTRNLYGHFLVFDRENLRLVMPPASDESMAMIVASTPWQFTNRGNPDVAALSVDERDPAHRIIIAPIVDDSLGVVGVAGMILDEDYFRKELLPKVVRTMLPSFFPSFAREELVVVVKDSRNLAVLSTGAGVPRAGSVQRGMPFVFSDWRMEIYSSESTPEQWARTNFAFNIALSVLLATALIGGVILAFRAANRAMKLSDMKSEFVSNVSHELRTPLSSIRVFGELLRLGRARTPERVQEYGAHIESEARRLSRLIDNILDFSRIDSGRKTYRFVPTDIGKLVESTVETFAVRLQESGFRLTLNMPDTPLPEVNADADAVGQALSNLLDNAVKYSGESRDIFVDVKTDRGNFVISVRDEGIGIARDEQPKVFERFHRVGTGLVHDVKGSGLGLSIVHHIVEAHRGRVTIDSQPGAGSTFSIHLPLNDSAEQPAGRGTDSGPAARAAV